MIPRHIAQQGLSLVMDASHGLQVDGRYLSEATKEEISKRLRERIKEEADKNPDYFSQVNLYTGTPIKEEASPGNFTIEMTPHGPMINYYWFRWSGGLSCETWPLYEESKK